MSELKKNHSLRAWAIWALVSFFYLYELALRIAPSIMISELMHDLDITAKYIGLLGFAYYISYTPLQLPIGVLFDRFGAKALLTIATLSCSLGAFLFGFSNHISLVLVARFIIGAGSSCAWIGVTYLISHWFEEKKTGMMIGLASSIGMMGGIFGAGPLAFLIPRFGWQIILIHFGTVGLLLTLLTWFVIRNAPSKLKTIPQKKLPNIQVVLHGLKMILTRRQNWWVALYSTTIYSCTAVFAELWGASFIKLDHDLDDLKAAFATSMIYIGWMIGGPLVGFISDYIGKRKPFLVVGAFATFITISCAIYLPLKGQIFWLYTILLLFGIFSNGQLLCFSLAIENNSSSTKGSALALTNFVTMLGGMVLNPFVGWILDLLWSGKIVRGLPTYTPHDFRIALSVLPILCIIGFFLTFLIKETYCKMVYTDEKHPFEFYSD